MPHFTIEYTDNLEPDIDIRVLVDQVHKTAAESGLFKIGGIRVRTLRHEIFKVADGNPDNAFVHVEVRILEGRTDAQREALGNALIAALGATLHKAFEKRGLALSVEIGEIDQNMSFKQNNLHERAGAPA